MPHNVNLLLPVKASEANLEEVIKNIFALAVQDLELDWACVI